MKKIGEKLSYLTKITLVIGLLISNLSSLSLVFAYEADELLQVVLNDEELIIEYLDNLEDYENVKLKINENYTYLDNNAYYFDEEYTGKVTTSTDLNAEEFLENGYELESILKDITFDGTYEVKVELLDTEDNLIDAATYSSDIKHSTSLAIKLYDEESNEIDYENGTYIIDKNHPKVKVAAKLLAGGFSPSEIYHKENSFEAQEYTALELLEEVFYQEFDYSTYLYGKYTQPVTVKLYKEINDGTELELVEFTATYNISYETEESNELYLNKILTELGNSSKYEFNKGNLYVLLNNEEIYNMLDLYNLLETAYGHNSNITYTISNGTYSDIVSSYYEETLEETFEETLEETLEEYLSNILVDNNTKITLSNTGLTLNYNTVLVGDLNSDNVVDELDLNELVNQLVQEETANAYNDLNRDEELNLLDVMYLDQLIKNETYDIDLEELEAKIDSKLVLNNDDIVSGDEFTVSYLVSIKEYEISGLSGLLKYDSEKLELVSISSPMEWNGTNKDGRFVFVGTDSLKADTIINEQEETELVAKDYVLIDITFKAKSAGSTEISLNNCEYFNQSTYLLVEENESTLTITINASNDNSLSSLVVAGTPIELEEDILDYEIIVSNEITIADVEAVVSNQTASITSIVSPEELVEGKNTITITVEAESGDIKIYTIVVNRESAPKEETTTQINYSSNNNTTNVDEEENKEDLVITTPTEDDDDEDVSPEEEDNLSRIIIIILILLVIAGLIYLIFKDDDDEETKKVNKEVNKLKKESAEISVAKEVKKTTPKPANKNTNNKNTTNKNKKNTNKKTER